MNNSVSSSHLFKKIQDELKSVYDKNEAQSIALLLIQKLFSINRTDVIINKMIEGFDAEAEEQLSHSIVRLKKSEPIQYILGETEFYGKILKVNPAVLIPRPETEELVDLIIKENQDKTRLKALDVCTGSGCIAIALQAHLKKSLTFALDISSEAIDLADKNALNNGIEINFQPCDILKEVIPWQGIQFDIIVSNPPYVEESERNLMHKNVLDYEPGSALFVRDSNPLIFYKRIVELSISALSKGGMLYFEINEKFGGEIRNLFLDHAFRDVEIIKDLSGKDRIVKGRFDSL